MTGAAFRILDALDPRDVQQWKELWLAWPEREVQAHPAYATLFAGAGVRALCASWRSSESGVLFPFLLRDLAREEFCGPDLLPAADIVTPYGYGGAYAWGRVEPALFWSCFDAWCQSQHVVSEFVRFNVLQQHLLEYPGTTQSLRLNVVRDLQLDEQALWADVSHKVRKNVKRARSRGVEVEVDTAGGSLPSFLEVYRSTLDRRTAGAVYDFPCSFFDSLHRELSGSFAYFHARAEDRIISSELVLLSARAAYSFLGGTLADSFDLRPNDLVKYEIIDWARARGLRWFVLGGGHEPEDGILRYKLSFAPRGAVPFLTGQRILNPRVYQELARRRQALSHTGGVEWTPRPGFFPVYRA